VDGAIHRAGGPSILAECRAIRAAQGECPPGEAVVTGAGNLKARFVIHTVGPIWSGLGDEATLARCYRNSLRLAVEKKALSIAFPNISTGVYRFPKPLAARVAWNTVAELLEKTETGLQEVIFVCFDRENFDLYRTRLSPKP
jgi:O-acetyl-ADP-ribose deacetylase